MQPQGRCNATWGPFSEVLQERQASRVLQRGGEAAGDCSKDELRMAGGGWTRGPHSKKGPHRYVLHAPAPREPSFDKGGVVSRNGPPVSVLGF